MSDTYAVCGCGWLGQPLARLWLEQGHHVIGTTRTAANAETLSSMGIQPCCFELGQPLPEAVAHASVLVLNIPPGRMRQQPQRFETDMTALLGQVGNTTRLIFISTSSVFAQQQGEVAETSQPQPETASGKVHWQLEQLIHQNFNQGATILRLAGLVGGQRHPARSLAGRSLSEGQRPVNLVHRDDVIVAIDRIIQNDIWNETLHLSCNEHPERASFYTWAARQAGLSPPRFSRDPSTGKTIHSNQTQKKLGLTLAYPSPYDMPVSVDD